MVGSRRATGRHPGEQLRLAMDSLGKCKGLQFPVHPSLVVVGWRVDAPHEHHFARVPRERAGGATGRGLPQRPVHLCHSRLTDYPPVDVRGLQYKFVNVGESTRARSRQIGETTWTKAEQGLAGVQSKCYDDAEVD